MDDIEDRLGFADNSGEEFVCVWVSIGGSNSRNLKNKFSSASLWCNAFLLNNNDSGGPLDGIPMQPSSTLMTSSTLDWEFSHISSKGNVGFVKHDWACSLNDPLIS